MATFLNFLKEQQPGLPLTHILLRDTSFPDTSDIKTMAQYLYLKLDQPSTTQFQQLLMLWVSLDAGIAKGSPEMLSQFNIIISLQTNDPNYPYYYQIPAHINNR